MRVELGRRRALGGRLVRVLWPHIVAHTENSACRVVPSLQHTLGVHFFNRYPY